MRLSIEVGDGKPFGSDCFSASFGGVGDEEEVILTVGGGNDLRTSPAADEEEGDGVVVTDDEWFEFHDRIDELEFELGKFRGGWGFGRALPHDDNE